MDVSKSDSEYVWAYAYDKTIDTIDELLYWLSLGVPCWAHFDHQMMVTVFGNGPFRQPARVTRVTHDNYVCFEGWHDSKACGYPIGMKGVCVRLGYSDFHNKQQKSDDAVRCWTITADDVNRMVCESDYVSLVDMFPEFETKDI